jgi:hypothetical protein
VRVVREDPDRRGLLYAGTEFGLYASFDDGAHWQSLQLNLPVTPVTDLLVHQRDLVVSTQGRAFWVLDDLSPLHQVQAKMETENRLFAPRPGYRSGSGQAYVYYHLASEPKAPVEIEVLDGQGQRVARHTGQPGSTGERPAQAQGFRRGAPAPPVPAKRGLNRFAWNARHQAFFEIPRGTVLWGGATPARLVPGTYQVKVTSGDWSQTQPIEILGDPRLETTTAEYREQFELTRRVGLRVKELYDNLAVLRDVKQQSTQLGRRVREAGQGDEVEKAAKALNDKLVAIEGELTQLEGEGGQDALNFPGRLDNQFITLYGEIVGDEKKPSQGETQRFADIDPRLTELLDQLEETLLTDLASFNGVVRQKNVDPVIVKAPARRATTSSQPQP